MIWVKRNLKEKKITKITKVKHEVYIYGFILKKQNKSYAFVNLSFLCEKENFSFYDNIYRLIDIPREVLSLRGQNSSIYIYIF